MSTAKFEKKTKRVFLYFVVTFLAAVFLLPLFWMIRSSLMTAGEIFIVPPIWFPKKLHFENFQKALTTVPFGLYFLNTLRIVVLNVIGAVLTSSISAYSFARLRWKGRNLIFGLLMSGMMLPGAVTLIPTFLGWRAVVPANSYLPLIIPAWFGGVFLIFFC